MLYQKTPTPMITAKILLSIIAVCHIFIPVIMYVNKTILSREIANKNPTFDAVTIAQSVDIALHSAVIFHAVLTLICLFGIFALSTKKRWSRRFISISQAFSVIFSIVSWSSSSMFHVLIPIIDIAAIAIIVLIWHPSIKTYFNGATSNG